MAGVASSQVGGRTRRVNFHQQHQRARDGDLAEIEISLTILEGIAQIMATLADIQTALSGEDTALAALGKDLDRIAADIVANSGNPAALQSIADEVSAHAKTIAGLQTTIDAVDPAPAAGGGTPPVALAVDTTTPLPDATVGAAYTAQVVVTGGTAPLTFSETPILNPSGLSMDSATGAITGTPTVAGVLTFNVVVTDSATPPVVAAGQLTITVS